MFRKKILTVVLFVFLGLTFCVPIYFTNLRNNLNGHPLDVQISLLSVDQIDTIIYVPIGAQYKFRLEYFCKDNIKSNEFENKVISIPIQWEVYSIQDYFLRYFISEQTHIASGQNTTDALYGFGKNYFFQNIKGADVFLKSGYYRIKANILKDIPEMKNTSVKMQMYIDDSYAFKHYFGSDVTFGIIFWALVFFDIVLIVVRITRFY